MSDTFDLSELPEHIQAQIREATAPKKPLFPIDPREHGGNFQTKEVKEMAQKIDLLIQGFNILWEEKSKPVKQIK